MFLNTKNEPIAVFSPEELDRKMENWPEAYYNELEAVNRKKLLDEAIKRQLDTYEEDQKRLELWNMRYTKANDPKDPNFYYDGFMRVFFDFRHLATKQSGFFGSKKGAVREIKKNLKKIGYLDDNGNISEDIYLLNREVTHMGTHYISICKSDKQYTSILWGFGSRKEKDVYRKIAKDFYEATDLLSNNFDLTEELKGWSISMTTAFQENIPDWQNILEDFSRSL